MNRDDVIESIRSLAQADGQQSLSKRRFIEASGVTERQLRKHFDSWNEACKLAGISPAPSGRDTLTPKKGITREACIAEMKRVAASVGRRDLPREVFFAISPLVRSDKAIRRLFGDWHTALNAAQLDVPNAFMRTIPATELAGEFLRAIEELRRIPTLRELARRSVRAENTLSKKFGGYATFKMMMIEILIERSDALSAETLAVLKQEQSQLSAATSQSQTRPAHKHSHGQLLRFRAFAHAPTYENEVVAMFGAVADELGFEILCSRSAFPDCEARRRCPGRRARFEKCLIEFELTSSDYRRHGHSLSGCDLVVCWVHDWPECPIEVLELREAIRRLPGWK